MKTTIPTSVRLLAAAFAGLATVAAQAEDAPQIIFISENQSAESAAQNRVEAEYNATQREALRETNFAAWEAYENVEWRDIPVEFRNARLAEILADLGLAPDDPADRGFTDFLEAQGFDVYRSWTEREADPITGAITVDHEFWGDIGTPFSASDDYRLSQEQIDRLEAADLVIMSPNTDAARYAWGGREGGNASTVLNEQWNGLRVPIISMNAPLIQTNEFGSWGWGWGYGFATTYGTLSPFNRGDQTPAELERFVFLDWIPRVRRGESPLLAGLEPTDGDRLAIYKDYETLPGLPRTPRKFSNNSNYSYPANVRVVLELDVPNFFTAGLEISTRDPILLDVAAGIRFFQPTGLPSERVGTPAERRIYLAAGLGNTGLYNFSSTGEQLFMNVVTQFTQPAGVTTYTVTFDLGDLGTRVGGGELVQTVAQGAAAFAPEVEADAGWAFTGWDAAFDNITADTTVTAQYEEADNGTWAGLPLEEDGTVVTEAFGTLFPLEDYAYVYRLEAWVYLPETFVTANGAWIFGPGLEDLPVDGDGWFEGTPLGLIHMDSDAGYLYIHGAEHWAFPTDRVENGGRWVFLFGGP
ncbi:MAG: InlB B-repeat-containing protein [Opitutales bacterium]|nr:InlB B-repeat-containing protein [Opitutales bacterium]